VAAVGCSVASQFLYDVLERPSKVSVPPKIAVTTDPVLSKSYRAKRVKERKRDPDGLDSNVAEGEAARGGPTSMHSWLPCRCIERESLNVA
jgi:hypothetical protein